ncbi:MAG: ABC transporter ATP-binding protein [Lentisphaeria bacterium]|nr:ABC transporter ATP-binding protein [Lentisphaeria bacterium]
MKLEVKGLRGGYGGKPVLDGVEFTVEPGTVATLLGANGCGKSTLLKMIGRILKPESGSVLLDGKAVGQYDTAELARKMAILPQLHQAPGDLTVEELTAFGRFPHKKGRPGLNAHDREMIGDALHRTRMDHLRHRPVGTLSGGERQRAWIAMTLAQEPEILLLDEPTTFLDVCCQFEIAELIRGLNRERGITVLMILHDLNLAARCSDQLILLKDKRVYRAGAPSEILTVPNLRAVFGIEAKIIPNETGVPYCIAVGSVRGEAQ